MLNAQLPFLLDSRNFYVIKNNTQQQISSNVLLFLKSKNLHKLVCKFKFSVATVGCFLLDLVCYELQQTTKTTKILCYLWGVGLCKLLTLTWSNLQSINSIEKLFFNAKWLEREISEMNGWFFFNKRDRRVLFLIPIVFNTPLSKLHPVGGFFDLMLCPLTHKLTFRHQSWLS